MSNSDKKECLEHKRRAELQRVLLPDAPPRKRQLKTLSPERDDIKPFLITSQSAMPGPSWWECVIVGDATPSSRKAPTKTPSPRKALPTTLSRKLGSKDSSLEKAVNKWLDFDSDSDVDLDIDTTEGSCLLPSTRQLHDVYDTDLAPELLRTLQSEDIANDRALLELLPDDCLTFNWTRENSVFKNTRELFTGPDPGPTFPLTNDTKPIDIFDKMFSVEFIDTLCTETNVYARQKISSLKDKLSVNSRLHRWTPTDRQEMISFLALTILQGLFPLVNEESYFSFNGFGTMPYFARIMSYNRYLLLKSMLHFVNNDTLTESLNRRNRLCKVQPVIDYFNDVFSSLYCPQQEIVIDESLLKWSGRLSFAQKISSKAAQVGVKTYELCESSTGYLWRFSVYAGKHKTGTLEDGDDTKDNTNDTNRPDQTDTRNTSDSDFRPRNATASIVFDLVEPLLYRGHTLIMDSFYNSPLLARCLKRRHTDCFGTQRLNREFIPGSLRTMTITDLRQGELVTTYCPDVSLMVWHDIKLVGMISTYHSLQIGTRERNSGTSFKPSVVLDYNKFMGGVDRKDQLLSAHPIERVRCRVWYKKLFRRLFNAAILNCHIIYNTKHDKLSHRQFRTVLAESLLKTYRQIDLTTESRLVLTGDKLRTKRNSRPTLNDRPTVEGDHFPVHAANKRSRCWWCAQNKVTRQTAWKCMECEVPLCILGCFREYHKP